MARDESESVTVLLQQWRDGDASALDRLMPIVYEELRRQAVGMMRGERRDHTLQATALIHEAWIRLRGEPVLPGPDERQFLIAASVAMRRVLVDSARRRCR